MVDDFKSAQKIKVLLWHGGLGGIGQLYWTIKLYSIVYPLFGMILALHEYKKE
jgi:hypothetical protein